MDRYIGKKLEGRYLIQEMIGVGGMANVYKATDLVENRLVAVKFLRDEYNDNEEFCRRFKNESKAIALLSHPNVVKVYDICFGERFKCIVMEFIDGITLKEYIDRQGVIHWKQALHFAVQTLKGLQHAHDKGIVHRDIKPHNIMLLADGTLKITDFGIARFARSETRTMTDRAIGSVHYISPEQAQAGKTDEKTDIYSVGIMLFEMLTGKLPFEADSPVGVALKQIQSQARRPRAINPDIPEGLEEITMRAMEKNTTKRYQSAAEMLRDIQEFKNNPSIVFEYKYLTREPLEAADATKVIPLTKKAEEVRRYAGAQNKEATQDRQEVKAKGGVIVKDKKNLYVPMLTGVTFAVVIFTLIFIITLIAIKKPLENMPDIKVPDLINQKYETVKRSEKYQDFQIRMLPAEYNEDYPSGVIFSQTPKSGKSVKPGQVIEVKVSSGQNFIILPDLKKFEASSAFSKLKDLGLTYEEKTLFDESISTGSVVRTDPEAGTEVSSGSTVVVYISRGKEDKLVDIPNLEGKKIEDAKAVLGNINLRIGEIEYQSSALPQGTIISQDPKAGTTIPEGEEVKLIISGQSSGDSTMDSSAGLITLMIQLPNAIDQPTKLQAVKDGSVISEYVVNPAVESVWRPQFSGTGIAYIDILIEQGLYQKYELDFDSGTYKLIE